jgi:putative sugar O-methyltransferase
VNLWRASHAATIDPERFRGHFQYLDQPPSYPYADLVRYCRAHHPAMLDAFTEDGAFGCVTATAGEGKTVSRDLLDSILEIGFLERHVPDLARATVLDIGAGYGRFAHRITTVYPWSFVWCTDAIEISQRVCEKYLTHRGVLHAQCARPHMLEQQPARVDLAVNVHSWSECSLDEVRWWLEWLERADVPRLFIVPHTRSLGCYGPNGGSSGESYAPELARCGYSLKSEWGGPECSPRSYLLFERTT